MMLQGIIYIAWYGGLPGVRCLKIQVSQKVWGTPVPELCPIHPKPSGRRGEIAKFKNITMQKL